MLGHIYGLNGMIDIHTYICGDPNKIGFHGNLTRANYSMLDNCTIDMLYNYTYQVD